MTRRLKTFAVGVCCVILLAQCDATGELSSDTASGEDVRSGPVLIPVCAVDEDCAEWGPNDPCGVYS